MTLITIPKCFILSKSSGHQQSLPQVKENLVSLEDQAFESQFLASWQLVTFLQILCVYFSGQTLRMTVKGKEKLIWNLLKHLFGRLITAMTPICPGSLQPFLPHGSGCGQAPCFGQWLTIASKCDRNREPWKALVRWALFSCCSWNLAACKQGQAGLLDGEMIRDPAV